MLTKSRFEICEISTVYMIVKTEYITNDNTKSFAYLRHFALVCKSNTIKLGLKTNQKPKAKWPKLTKLK